MVHLMLFPMLNVLHISHSTYCCMCAVPRMAVFCISWILCFLGVLLRYFQNDFEIVLFAHIITHIMFYIPHALYFCCNVFLIFYNLLSIFLDHISAS